MTQTDEQRAAERPLEDALEMLVQKLDELVNTGDMQGAHALASEIIARFTIESARTRSLRA